MHDLCRTQLLLSADGPPISIRLEAVKVAMDILGIEDQINTARKVIAYTEVLYHREKEDNESNSIGSQNQDDN